MINLLLMKGDVSQSPAESIPKDTAVAIQVRAPFFCGMVSQRFKKFGQQMWIAKSVTREGLERVRYNQIILCETTLFHRKKQVQIELFE